MEASSKSDPLKRKYPEHGPEQFDCPSLKRIKIEGDQLDTIKNDIASVCPLCERKGEIKNDVFLCRHCKVKFNNFSCVHCTEKFTTMPALLDHITVCYQKHVTVKTEPGEPSDQSEILPGMQKAESSCDSSSDFERSESGETKKQKLDDMAKKLDEQQIKTWVGKFRDFIKKQTVKIKATEDSNDINVQGAHTANGEIDHGHETENANKRNVIINSTDLKTNKVSVTKSVGERLFRVSDSLRDCSPVTDFSGEETERYSDTDTKTDSQFDEETEISDNLLTETNSNSDSLQTETNSVSDSLQTETNSDSDSQSELSDASGFEEIDLDEDDIEEISLTLTNDISKDFTEVQTDKRTPIKITSSLSENDNCDVLISTEDDSCQTDEERKTGNERSKNWSLKVKLKNLKETKENVEDSVVSRNESKLGGGDKDVQSNFSDKTSVPETQQEPIRKKRGRKKKVQENTTEVISPENSKENSKLKNQKETKQNIVDSVVSRNKSKLVGGRDRDTQSDLSDKTSVPETQQEPIRKKRGRKKKVQENSIEETLHENSKEDSNKEELCADYICGQCKQQFKSLSSLTEHLKSHSQNIQIVGKNQQRKTSPLRPQVSSSSDVTSAMECETNKELICGICTIHFNTMEKLSEHMESHVSKCKYDFVCNQCERICESLEKLREHMHSHLEPSEEFVCGLCQSSFSTASNLETHIITHNIVSSNVMSSYTMAAEKTEIDKGNEQPPTTVSKLLKYRPKFAIFNQNVSKSN